MRFVVLDVRFVINAVAFDLEIVLRRAVVLKQRMRLIRVRPGMARL